MFFLFLEAKSMKKLLACLFAFVMLLSMTACGSKEDDEPKKVKESKKDKEIVAAIEMLEEKWAEIYEDESYENDKGYFEIKNIRKIKIKDTLSVDAECADLANETFGNVDYILEFVLYTDYYSSSQPFQTHIYNEIVVHEDGSMEFSARLLTNYATRVYDYDYSGIIESIEDYGSLYNYQKNLKG